jgi:hypothetical protein
MSAPATPPEGAAADWTIDQGWSAYTDEEHRTWVTLYERQLGLLPGGRATRSCAGSTRSTCTAKAFPTSRGSTSS